MKFQIFSDLHLELYSVYNYHYSRVQVHPDADVVFLLGDIHSGLNSFRFAAELVQRFGKRVVWLPGNHEFYGHQLNSLLAQYKKIKYEGVYKLLGLPSENIEDNYHIIDGVRICGGTLWTNFKLYEGSVRIPTQEKAARLCRINDFNKIWNGDVTFTAFDSIDLHNQTYKVIDDILNIPFEGKTLVASHHGPHPGSIHPRYSPSIHSMDSKVELQGENKSFNLNPGFCSNLTDLLLKADVWLHGHVHDSFDYMVEDTRIIANPRGYFIEDYYEARFENREYKAFDLYEI